MLHRLSCARVLYCKHRCTVLSDIPVRRTRVTPARRCSTGSSSRREALKWHLADTRPPESWQPPVVRRAWHPPWNQCSPETTQTNAHRITALHDVSLHLSPNLSARSRVVLQRSMTATRRVMLATVLLCASIAQYANKMSCSTAWDLSPYSTRCTLGIPKALHTCLV